MSDGQDDQQQPGTEPGTDFKTKDTVKTDAMTKDRLDRKAYWRRNLQYLAVLLCIWFVVSYGCAIIFADALDEIQIAGFKLGFWFGHQGSIYVFVVLIWVYVWLMNRLDKEFDVHEGEG